MQAGSRGARGWLMSALATIVFLQGCSSSGSFDSVNNPYLLPDGGGPVVANLRSFGDSYSVPGAWGGSWNDRLAGMGRVERVTRYAVGGARSQGGARPEINFNNQVSRFLRQDGNIGARDLTVTYFGYNDIGRTGSPDNLARARASYDEGINRLINAGAIADERRLFVTQLHDWGRNPGVANGVRGQVQGWNAYLAEVANRHPNLVAVDLFTVFEDVYANPPKYGLVDVSNINAGRSASDFLYHDEIHFGGAGLNIIARTFNHYLTRGWDWANSLAAGGAASSQLQSDIDNGLLTLRLQNQGRESDKAQAFEAFPLGPSGAERGIGLHWRDTGLPGNASAGVALLNQTQQFNTIGTNGLAQSQAQTSDGLGTWFRLEAGQINATTQVAHVNHNHRRSNYDDILNRTANWQANAETTSFQQRLDREVELAHALLIPWVALKHQSLSMDSVQASSLYTSSTRVDLSDHQQTTGTLGLSVLGRGIILGHGRKLHLGASMEWENGLSRDTIDVQFQERAMPGLAQQESVELGRLERTSVSMNAALSWSENTDLGLQFTHAEARGSGQNQGMLSLTHRF